MTNLSDHNLCEIPIHSTIRKKKIPSVRRVGSVPSLPTLCESKRPGEYYIQKYSSSALQLQEVGENARPESLTSDGSKESDDASSLGSSHFDPTPDSRLSSMTSHSVYSNRASQCSNANIQNANIQAPSATTPAGPDVSDDSHCQSVDSLFECDDMSASTITLKKEPVMPKLRSRSTSNIIRRSEKLAKSENPPAIYRTNTAASSSSFMLSRSKTRYYNPQESKERKQLRKKAYDDNESDDVILPDDLDLVFNVPVIKNHAELFMTPRRGSSSSSSSSLSRHDLVNADDNKYTSSYPMKPCPLPGKLSQSHLSLDTQLPSMPEEPEKDHTVSNDSQISANISDFYNQRLVSYSKLVKKSREQLMVYKLPNYVKSQSSVDDLSLFSPEKLDAVDQSRPINLPPKCSSDKAKHNKEFFKNLSSFEHSTRIQNESRVKSGESLVANQKAWFKLIADCPDGKLLSKKLSHEKNAIRKLAWDSIIPEKLRMDFFSSLLSLSVGEDYAADARSKYLALKHRYAELSDQMISSKDAEFASIIDSVLLRPLFSTFINDVFSSGSDFDMLLFKENFKTLLYMRSLSEDGLKKHHETFVIPVFLILFQHHEPLDSVYVLMKMFDKHVFSASTIDDVNKYLARWCTLSLMHSYSHLYKSLSRFDSLEEFECLNFTNFFDIIIQLHDQMPLSLSAPSTPIIAQGAFTPLSSAKPSSEYGEDHRSSTNSDKSARSLESFDFNTAFMRSSSLSLVSIFLQLLVVYGNSPKSKKRNFLSLFQGFLLTVFKYYHINWNSYTELVRNNKPIKLNNSNDQHANLTSFLDKWRDTFDKMS